MPAQHADAGRQCAQGVLPGELRQTCTACATTLLLEFGTLSRLTGDPRYERAAAHAVRCWALSERVCVTHAVLTDRLTPDLVRRMLIHERRYRLHGVVFHDTVA